MSGNQPNQTAPDTNAPATQPTPDHADVHQDRLRRGGKGATGGFILGLMLEVFGSTAPAANSVPWLAALPFAMALAGFVIAY